MLQSHDYAAELAARTKAVTDAQVRAHPEYKVLLCTRVGGCCSPLEQHEIVPARAGHCVRSFVLHPPILPPALQKWKADLDAAVKDAMGGGALLLPPLPPLVPPFRPPLTEHSAVCTHCCLLRPSLTLDAITLLSTR
jgi:hypothetical protein